jgi:hypothetical protein
MKEGAGRRSSPLDEIRPAVWTEQLTAELLELLWVVERTVALDSHLDGMLSRIVATPTIPADQLPTPTDAERSPPS